MYDDDNRYSVEANTAVCAKCKPQIAELKAENKRLKKLEGALKVICTWASYDMREGYQLALVPKDVVDLCKKHHLIR